MTSRLYLIAALLTVAAATTGSAAVAADSVAGNRGPADRAQNRDAPLTLPGKVTARATPKVDTNLGTVTLGADGNVTETPASDALRSIFESAVQGRRPGK